MAGGFSVCDGGVEVGGTLVAGGGVGLFVGEPAVWLGFGSTGSESTVAPDVSVGSLVGVGLSSNTSAVEGVSLSFAETDDVVSFVSTDAVVFCEQAVSMSNKMINSRSADFLMAYSSNQVLNLIIQGNAPKPKSIISAIDADACRHKKLLTSQLD